MKIKEIYHIVIEGHNFDEVQSLFEEIQNKYSLYDNCVMDTKCPMDTIIDKDRNEECGCLSIDKKIPKKCGH